MKVRDKRLRRIVACIENRRERYAASKSITRKTATYFDRTFIEVSCALLETGFTRFFFLRRREHPNAMHIRSRRHTTPKMTGAAIQAREMLFCAGVANGADAA